MADTIQTENSITKKYRDMGDGTFAEIVSSQGLNGGANPVEPLGIPSVPRQLAAGASSTNLALTSSCKRVSMVAVGANIRYLVGSTTQTAAATSHLILDGERIDIALPTTPNIAAIRDASTSGVLEITELA